MTSTDGLGGALTETVAIWGRGSGQGRDLEIRELLHRPRRISPPTEIQSQSAFPVAIANALEGMDRASTARLAGMDRQTLRDWVHRYNAEGIAGLCSRPAPGRKLKLTEGQMGPIGVGGLGWSLLARYGRDNRGGQRLREPEPSAAAGTCGG